MDLLGSSSRCILEGIRSLGCMTLDPIWMELGVKMEGAIFLEELSELILVAHPMINKNNNVLNGTTKCG